MDEREKLSCAHMGTGIKKNSVSNYNGLKKDQMTEANSP
jgi:hypothetical protein